jgi:hypothetical protein
VVPPCFSSKQLDVVQNPSFSPSRGQHGIHDSAFMDSGSEASSAIPGLVRTVHQLSHIQALCLLLLVTAAQNSSRAHSHTGRFYGFGSSDGTSVFAGPFFPIACATSQNKRSTGPINA